MPSHSDDEDCIEDDSDIVTVSLGATRKLVIREIVSDKVVCSRDLKHGSVCVMSKSSQSHYKHEIAEDRHCKELRLSFTFRLVKKPLVSEVVSHSQEKGSISPSHVSSLGDTGSSGFVPFPKHPSRDKPKPASQSLPRQSHHGKSPSQVLYISSSMFRHIDVERLSSDKVKASKLFYPGANASIMLEKLKKDLPSLKNKPSAIYVMSGTNNVDSIYYGSRSLKETHQQLTALIEYLKLMFPNAELNVINVLPRSTNMELECTKGLEELVSEVIVHAVNNENTTKKKGNAEAVIIEENIVENPDSNIVIETFSAEESESMDIEGVESNEIETITRTDEPLVSESTATNEQNAIADSPELSNSNNETPEQPAAITTAITTIISHFVISSDGLTKNRLEILQKLLNELSNCDEEAKFAVEALQSILSELQPQGSSVDIIPSLVYDPSSKKSDDIVADPLAPVLVLSNPEPMEVEVAPSTPQCTTSQSKNDTMMKDLLKTQRNRQSVENPKASTYDLCLWCNKLVVSGKTKDHAMIKHRAISFHESFTCPFCLKVFNSNNTVIEHLRFIPLCSKSENDQPITCSLCRDDFVGAGTLREHYIIFHNIGISTDSHNAERRAFWSCMYCGIAEHSKAGLSKHIKTYHHAYSPHFCRFCGINYFSMLGLHKHLIIQHRVNLGDTLYDYYSLVCDFNFTLENVNVPKKMCCTYCDEEVTNNAEFELHIMEVHFCKERKLYLCSFCTLTFPSKEPLEKHVMNGHLLGGLGFNMNLPKVDFSKWKPIEVASSSITAQNNGLDKDVEGIDAIASEVLLPQNVTFFLCSICKETAHSIDHFREHSTEEIYKAAVLQIGDNHNDWMVSDKCGVLRSMMSILVTTTGANSPEVICKICKKLLGSREMFNFHFVNKHLKKAKVQCGECNKYFRDKMALDLHMKRAHELRIKAPGKTSSHYVIKSMKQHKGPNKVPIELVIPDADKIVDITSDETTPPDVVTPKKPPVRKEQPKLCCTLCPYTCYRIDHLEEHIQAKHYKNSVNQCTMCNSRYSRRRDLRRHYINKHNLPQAVAREMTELTTPTEPWRAKMETVRRGRKPRRSCSSMLDAGEIVNVSSDKDNSNDNLCDINPDILDISLVGNLDKD
ncbi:hypothetical protein ACHWQZ_G002793 [Mnemiopsis leidyi]